MKFIFWGNPLPRVGLQLTIELRGRHGIVSTLTDLNTFGNFCCAYSDMLQFARVICIGLKNDQQKKIS